MAFLRKLFGSDEQPEWTRFMPRADFQEFSSTLKKALNQFAPGHHLDINQGLWRMPGEDNTRGLLNAAQLFHTVDKAYRKQALTEFIQNTATLDLHAEEPTLEEAKPLLRVRLLPWDIPARENLTLAPVGEGFFTALFLDYPTHTKSVLRDTAAGWGTDLEELFSLAMENVWEYEKPDEHSTIDLDGATLDILVGNSFYTATHALLLDRHGEETEFGTLVAVPHRHAVLYHRIQDSSVVDVINRLPLMTRGMFLEGPGSVSPEVFWVRNGMFRILPFVEEGGQINFHVPEDFGEVLDRLG